MKPDIFDDLGNTNFADVDTKYPVLVPDKYEWLITGMEKKESENTGGSYIEVKLALQSPNAHSTKGAEVNVGYQVTHTLGLTPSAKFSVDAIKANIARFMDAVIGSREWDPTFALYLRKTCWARTGIQKEQTGDDGTVYPEKTVIKQFIPLG